MRCCIKSVTVFLFFYLRLSSAFIILYVPQIPHFPPTSKLTIQVTWIRSRIDPSRFKVLILDGKNIRSAGTDVRAKNDELIGHVMVSFPRAGSYYLTAVGSMGEILGLSDEMQIGLSMPEKSSETSSLIHNPSSISRISDPTVARSPESKDESKQHRLPVILCSIFGTLIPLALFIVLFILWERHQEREAKSSRRVTFHRELMVQQQCRPLPPSSGTERGPSVPSTRSLPLPPHFAFPATTTHQENSPTPRSPNSVCVPPPLPPRRGKVAPKSAALTTTQTSPRPLPATPYNCHKNEGRTHRTTSAAEQDCQFERSDERDPFASRNVALAQPAKDPSGVVEGADGFTLGAGKGGNSSSTFCK